MKTKYWIGLLCVIASVCLTLSIPMLLPRNQAQAAEIISDGRMLCTVPLYIDTEFTVSSSNGGTNTITVKNGKVGVTAASCPDHYCMDRGMCSNGAQIICLPNRLAIRFVGNQTIDSVSE